MAAAPAMEPVALAVVTVRSERLRLTAGYEGRQAADIAASEVRLRLRRLLRLVLLLLLLLLLLVRLRWLLLVIL
jgi:hypothetical protein